VDLWEITVAGIVRRVLLCTNHSAQARDGRAPWVNGASLTMNGPEYGDAPGWYEELAPLFASDPAIAQADLAARGLRPVSVIYGSGEDPEEAKLVCQTLPDLARRAGQLWGQRSGHRFTTYLYTGPRADAAVVELTATLLGIAPPWWRITPTAHPVWQVDPPLGWEAGEAPWPQV
jgi:hypothetical protein